MRAASGVPIVVALILAGCVDVVAPVETSAATTPIDVPGFAWGETWSYQHTEGRSPWRWTVASAPAPVPNRFGQSVPGATITFSNDLPMIAFDVEAGQLLWDGGHVHDRACVPRGHVISEYEFTLEAAVAEWGTLRGLTLEVGDHYVFSQLRRGQLTGDDANVHTEVQEFRVITRTWARSPLTDTVVDAMLVNVTGHRRTVAGEPLEATKWAAEHVYVDGVGVPVTIQADDWTQTLVDYSPGATPIEFGRNPNRSHYEARHPGAKFAVPGLTPDFSGLDLEFPVEDAIAEIRSSPASATASTWFATNQGPWTEAAVYERLPGSAEWRFTFTDEDDGIHATATRSFGVDSHQDSASSGLPFEHEESRPRPIVPIVDAATALSTAKAFEPELEEWAVMEWGALPTIDSKGPHYGFAQRNPDGGCATVYGPGRLVHAATGALAPNNYHGP